MSGNVYTPDRWVILKLNSDVGSSTKILASWYGGFAGSDSWKLSSGNEAVHDCGTYWEIPQASGSVYHLYKNAVGMSMYATAQLERFRKVPGLTITFAKEDCPEDWV